jgi:NAD(P)-dependent dehydrogenase (short-subunit alcohol dehydrogenase family)
LLLFSNSVTNKIEESIRKFGQLGVTGTNQLALSNKELNSGVIMTTSQIQELDGQRALVTGATSGIGRAIAVKLASQGAEVIIHGRDARRGAQTVDEIKVSGGKARFIVADISDPVDIQRLIDEAGDIDILVNNAGYAVWGPTGGFDVKGFDGMYASNVRAPFLLVAGFAPGMAARGKGCIVNISSMAGRLGLLNGAAYGATKAALASLTQAWAAGVQPERRQG